MRECAGVCLARSVQGAGWCTTHSAGGDTTTDCTEDKQVMVGRAGHMEGHTKALYVTRFLGEYAPLDRTNTARLVPRRTVDTTNTTSATRLTSKSANMFQEKFHAMPANL